ncbi:MAG: hypothetical protein WBP29_07960 [Candidatus Zixiibacteriota bacterium]
MADISPEVVLSKVAAAIPKEVRKHITIIGSLAAGYALRSRIGHAEVRTKDIDCVLFPFAHASVAGVAIARKLLEAGWTLKEDDDFPAPGDKSTSLEKLPVVRLYPPDGGDWFLELLTVPRVGSSGERFTRLIVDDENHFALPSFKFLPIAIFEPMETPFGICCARVEMMAFANLLENPEIKPALMRGLIESRRIKRSNKDLGRSIALALICDDEIGTWPVLWRKALEETFPKDWKSYGKITGTGLRLLAASEMDIEQACHASNNGLLAYSPKSVEQFRIAIKRFQADCIDPFGELCR